MLCSVLILAACGGSARPKPQATKKVRGHGFTLATPAGWRVVNGGDKVIARDGGYLVSVSRFRLVKRYDPAHFAAAAAELDRVVSTLAARSHGTVTERTTTTVDGSRVRVYRYTSAGVETRIGFVLRDLREYELLCQLPAGAADRDGACTLLFSSFSGS
jgi:hypothetical protein